MIVEQPIWKIQQKISRRWVDVANGYTSQDYAIQEGLYLEKTFENQYRVVIESTNKREW